MFLRDVIVCSDFFDQFCMVNVGVMLTEFQRFLCAVYPRRKIYSDRDVRYVQSCIDSVKQGEDAVADCLLPIRKLKDTADGDILIETLCTYLLDAESNTQSTGTLLYLHKNTVHYRLNKIRSVLKCDLVQMPATLAVYKAAVVYRILKGI